jgi:hypothetical protein
MALKFEKGVFTVPGSTGNQTVSLIDAGFGTVKAILLWTSNQTGEGEEGANAFWSHGIGTYRGGTPQQYAISAFLTDVAGTPATASGSRTSSILRGYLDATPTVDWNAALVSLGDAQFVINWTDLPGLASIKVHYVALGGAEITDALVSSVDLTTGTGNQDVTVASGFGKPDLCLSVGTNSGTSDLDATFFNPIYLGVGKSDTDQFISLFCDSDNQTDVLLSSYQRSGRMFAYVDGAASVFLDAALAARADWPTDGIRVNKITNSLGGTARQGLLSLRGTFTSVISSGTAPTAAPTVNQDLAVGATPRGAIFVHNSIPTNAAADITHADLGTWGIGAMDGTREGWGGIGDDDAAADSNTHRHHSESKTIKMFTPSGTAGTLASEADGSFNGNDVRLTWADTDSVAREYMYLLLGDETAGAPAPTLRTVRSNLRLT